MTKFFLSYFWEQDEAGHMCMAEAGQGPGVLTPSPPATLTVDHHTNLPKKSIRSTTDKNKFYQFDKKIFYHFDKKKFYHFTSKIPETD